MIGHCGTMRRSALSGFIDRSPVKISDRLYCNAASQLCHDLNIGSE